MAPVVGPLNEALHGGPWLTTGAVPTGALVRSAAFGMSIDGLASTNAASVGVFTPHFQANVWVRSSDFLDWDVMIGISTDKGDLTPDWHVEVAIDPDEKSVVVATPRARTLEDKLVHGKEHDRLRDDLLRALALAVPAPATAEAEVSAKSLQTEVPFRGPAPDPREVSFQISTSLGADAARERLNLLGHRVLENGTNAMRWGLGLPNASGCNQIAFEFRPGRLDGTASISDPSPVGRRFASTDLRSFIGRALFLIKASDDAAGYEGPEEWAP
jgi:hypothetical protein